MKPALPDVIERYFQADRAGDAKALAACFTVDATVRDEGRTVVGPAAIEQWLAEAKAKYRHTTEPLEAAAQDGRTVVTARVTGQFPGSPIELGHAFTLDGDRIAALEIG